MEKEEKKLIKVLLSIPTEGYTKPQALNCLLRQRIRMGWLECHSEFDTGPFMFQFSTMTAGRLHHAFARDWLSRNALDGGMDYILMQDDDHTGPDDIFERLFSRHVDIVGAKAFTRNAPHKCVIYSVKHGWDDIEKKETMERKYVENYPDTGLVECDAVGFGTVLIKTEILKKVFDKFGTAFMTSSANGEDVIFCDRAKKVGAKIYMDMDCEIPHIGQEVIIDSKYAEQMNNHKNSIDLYGVYSKTTEGLGLA